MGRTPPPTAGRAWLDRALPMVADDLDHRDWCGPERCPRDYFGRTCAGRRAHGPNERSVSARAGPLTAGSPALRRCHLVRERPWRRGSLDLAGDRGMFDTVAVTAWRCGCN